MSMTNAEIAQHVSAFMCDLEIASSEELNKELGVDTRLAIQKFVEKAVLPDGVNSYEQAGLREQIEQYLDFVDVVQNEDEDIIVDGTIV